MLTSRDLGQILYLVWGLRSFWPWLFVHSTPSNLPEPLFFGEFLTLMDYYIKELQDEEFMLHDWGSLISLLSIALSCIYISTILHDILLCQSGQEYGYFWQIKATKVFHKTNFMITYFDSHTTNTSDVMFEWYGMNRVMSNLFKLGIHLDSSAVFIKWQRLLQVKNG